jgi:hypothetical protein
MLSEYSKIEVGERGLIHVRFAVFYGLKSDVTFSLGHKWKSTYSTISLAGPAPLPGRVAMHSRPAIRV